jgi:mycothiol synthase
VIVRRPSLEDAPAVTELLRLVEEAATGEPEWSEADLTHEWSRLDLDQDAWLVEVDGRPAGYVHVERRGEHVIADGYVHPGLERRGIGSELLRVTEERARELDAERLYNPTWVGDPCVDALYERLGYSPARYFWRMLAELDAEPTVRLPAGIELRRMRYPDDARTVYETLDESFADHWNHRPRTFEEWAPRVFGRPDFEADLSWLALEGDEVVGASANNWKHNGDWGWIGALGVRRPWRRRGIGEALLEASFAGFFRRGERRVALGVDAQSETGATRLYEKAGMRVLWESVVYEKDLRSQPLG